MLPTGAGKTVIGMKAMELVNQSAVVCVPTLDLLEQWKRRVQKELNIEVGVSRSCYPTKYPIKKKNQRTPDTNKKRIVTRTNPMRLPVLSISQLGKTKDKNRN